MCRASKRADVIAEMDKCKEASEQYYPESGNLFTAVGILRAADMYWTQKR